MLLRILALLLLTTPAFAATSTGNSAIFFHPDGIGVNGWNAYRFASGNLDAPLAWDSLPALALYNGSHTDRATATSNGAATAHATGDVQKAATFGSTGRTLVKDALASGLNVALLQSGAIYEPGTAAYVAHAAQRSNHQSIALQVIESSVPIIMTGGEEWLLPAGTTGRTVRANTGEATIGKRTDGRNLINEAAARGYTLAFTANELEALCKTSPLPQKVLGVFAAGHTFDDRSEDKLNGKNLYVENAPTSAAMMQCTLRILTASNKPFLIIAEEEGSDNFGNKNNAAGMLEAIGRADKTLSAAHAYVQQHPNTLLITTADSDAGGISVISPTPEFDFDQNTLLPTTAPNGAPVDGQTGAGGKPFITTYKGKRLPFAISWSTFDDVPGTTVVRAAGKNASHVQGTMHSTDVHDVIYNTIFKGE